MNVPERQTRIVEVDVEVVPLSELRAGPCVMGGKLVRVVVIDRTSSTTKVVVLSDGALETQVYGSSSTPFLVLREEAVS